MRSLLLVSANDDAAIEAAIASGADTIVLDIVDTADPIGSRGRAKAFPDRQSGGPFRYIRINPLSSDRAVADLDAVVAAWPDGIVLAGTEGGADVLRLSALIRPREAAAGLADRSIRVIASVTDAPAAVFGLGSYVGSGSRLAGLLWDSRGLASALGIEVDRGHDGVLADSLRAARLLVLAAAASARVPAIDGAFPVANDLDGLEKEAAAARRAGFAAKLAVHPDQVPVINRVFRAPSNR